jgi:hypothetical protein
MRTPETPARIAPWHGPGAAVGEEERERGFRAAELIERERGREHRNQQCDPCDRVLGEIDDSVLAEVRQQPVPPVAHPLQ